MSSFGRWASRILLSLFCLVLLLLLIGFTYEESGRSHDASGVLPRIGQAVDIGGRALNLYCTGEGSPTVILEAGAGGPGYEWAQAQPKIATFTRACWYDHAGVGWSDPPTSPRTSASVVKDLHEILSRTGIRPPYVLVGASIGGEYARVYTHQYPLDVAGLVFVDSSHPDQQEPAFMLSRVNQLSPGARHFLCTAMPFAARFGLLRFAASHMGPPVSAQSYPEERIIAELDAQPKAIRADADQFCAATNGGRFTEIRGTGNPELDGAARDAGSLGDRPLVVLTAGKFWAPPGLEKEAAHYHEIWVYQLQASLAALSTRGRQVVVDAHHDMDEAPDAVVTATQEVVTEVRGKK